MGFIDALKPFWHPVLREEELPEGKPVQAKLLDELVVLYRNGDEIVCFQDLCIHRGAALSLGKLQGENLECPYHGFQYAPNGRCVRIPSLSPDQPIPEKARVVKYRAKEIYGAVWVALEEPKAEIFDFPEYSDSAYRSVLCTHDWKANAARVIENNYDYTHIAFLHNAVLGLKGDDQVREGGPAPARDGWETVPMVADTSEPNYAHSHQPVGPARITRRYFSKIVMPLTSHTLSKGLDDGKETSDVYMFPFVASPISENETRTFVWVARNFALDWPDSESAFMFDHIIQGDVEVVENQHPKLLPTDLRKEVFLASEAHQVDYRRWLRELGVD